MGKTTNEYIDHILKEIDSMNKLRADFDNNVEQALKLIGMYNSAVADRKNNYRKMVDAGLLKDLKSVNRALNYLEKGIASAEKYRKQADVFTKKIKRISVNYLVREKAMDSAVERFDKYVEAKSKSKNPFKKAAAKVSAHKVLKILKKRNDEPLKFPPELKTVQEIMKELMTENGQIRLDLSDSAKAMREKEVAKREAAIKKNMERIKATATAKEKKAGRLTKLHKALQAKLAQRKKRKQANEYYRMLMDMKKEMRDEE